MAQIGTKKSLSVIHISTRDTIGGDAKVAWRLAQSHRSSGHESKLLVGYKFSKSSQVIRFPIDASPEMKHLCHTNNQLFYEFQGSHKLVDHPIVRSADILHLHNLHGMYFNPFSLSALSHLKPIVWTLHDMQSITGHCAHSFDCNKWQTGCGNCPSLDVQPALTFDTSAQLLADKKLIYDHSFLNLVTPSNWLKKKVEKSILKDHPVELIYNGVDTTVFRPHDKSQARRKFGIPENVPVIGAVAHGGALKNQWKGGKYTQAALKALPGNFIFINIGGKDEQTNDPRIINIPHMTDECELAQAYSTLDIFLYSPIADNCPLVILEAMSCRVPIVSFDTGGIRELVLDGKQGRITPYLDQDILMRTVHELIGNPDQQLVYAHNARQRAVENFDHEIIAAKYELLYEKILNEQKSVTRTTKLFPISKIPKIIMTKDFLHAENSKSVVETTPPVTDLTEQPTSINISNSKDTSITIATSIAPKNIERQKNAIESWLRLGFNVVSLNCQEEIGKLKQHFPDVTFIESSLNAMERFGKPLIYLDDILQYFLNSNTEFCGIVNSDIYLTGDSSTVGSLKDHCKDGLVYGSRTDVASFDNLQGKVYWWGYDYFFFSRPLITHLKETEFCIGIPWWDYWVPLISILKGFKTKKITSQFAYHIKHEMQWNRDNWKTFGKHIISRLCEETSPSNPSHDNPLSRLFWETIHSNYKQICQPHCTDEIKQEKMATDIFSSTAYLIVDFLDKNSTHISLDNESIQQEKVNNTHLITEAKPMAQSIPPAPAQYDVTIVLGTKDRAQLLDRMLESLKDASNGIKCEVIVIDGNSGDNTLQVLQKHQITRVYSESQCLGPGRHSWGQISNFGFAKARGKWVMYGSDDIIFSKDCLTKAVHTLNTQSDEVAAGVFFYRNTQTRPDWDKFGIDFTLGQKLLMNYGLFRLEHFNQVGGLNEQYRFYCSDGDLCYKMYSAGKQFIVLPECFVEHNNILDKHKQENADAGDKDIALYKENWKHYVSVESPNPRRLLWNEDYIDAFKMPMSITRKGPGIEYYWHGLSCFQYRMFDLAAIKFQQAIEAGFDHELLRWFLKKSQEQCPAQQKQNLADEFIRNQSTPVIQTEPPQNQSSTSLDKIKELGLWNPTEPLRLHLGCGKWRFDGYVNIDYPPEEHNVEIELGADFYTDITKLTFDSNSVDEIRLHHVFEHFNRVNALALLIRWHRWLKTEGHLRIETPDLIGSAKTLLSNASWKTKMGVVRHIAGDQASQWGYHVDHWFAERFDHTLTKLGFGSIQTQTSSWQQEPWLSNVEVLAVKARDVSLKEQLIAADELLWESTVADKEQKTWDVWRQQLRQALEVELAHIPNEETVCRK